MGYMVKPQQLLNILGFHIRFVEKKESLAKKIPWKKFETHWISGFWGPLQL